MLLTNARDHASTPLRKVAPLLAAQLWGGRGGEKRALATHHALVFIFVSCECTASSRQQHDSYTYEHMYLFSATKQAHAAVASWSISGSRSLSVHASLRTRNASLAACPAVASAADSICVHAWADDTRWSALHTIQFACTHPTSARNVLGGSPAATPWAGGDCAVAVLTAVSALLTSASKSTAIAMSSVYFIAPCAADTRWVFVDGHTTCFFCLLNCLPDVLPWMLACCKSAQMMQCIAHTVQRQGIMIELHNTCQHHQPNSTLAASPLCSSRHFFNAATSQGDGGEGLCSVDASCCSLLDMAVENNSMRDGLYNTTAASKTC